MANAVEQFILSGSTQGRRIKVAATASPGTLIHTTGVDLPTVKYDRLYLNAVNTDTADWVLTLQMGGTTSPDDLITVPLPAGVGVIVCVDGDLLAGDGASGLSVRAFVTGGANKVTVGGYAARVTV